MKEKSPKNFWKKEKFINENPNSRKIHNIIQCCTGKILMFNPGYKGTGISWDEIKNHPYLGNIFDGISIESLKLYWEIINDSGDIDAYLRILKQYRNIIDVKSKNLEKILTAITFYIKNKITDNFNLFLNIFFKSKKKDLTMNNYYTHIQFLGHKRHLPYIYDEKALKDSEDYFNQTNEFNLMNYDSENIKNLYVDINDNFFNDYNLANDYYWLKSVEEKEKELFDDEFNPKQNDNSLKKNEEEFQNNININVNGSINGHMEVDS